MKTVSLIAILLLLCGCTRIRAYQVRATEKCEARHTVEQCKPLAYPSTVSGNFGGVQTRRE
jgi:hypothetical protein